MHLIKKTYHFYAAHRNELIEDKCRNLHGHTYYIEVELRMRPPGASGITTLFSDIDKIIEPIIQALDHTTLVHVGDPLARTLEEFNEAHPDYATTFKVFPFVTSAENIARYLFERIANTGLDPTVVSLKETTSSTVAFGL